MSNTKTGSESENLSRIRDILFGEEIQSIEQQIAFFKKENTEKIEHLKKEMVDRLGGIEKSINENRSFSDEIQRKFSVNLVDFRKEIKLEVENLNLEHNREKEKMEISFNEKTDEILQKIKNLEKSFSQNIDALKEDHKAKSDRLNKEKISKDTIANLLTELVEKLKQ